MNTIGLLALLLTFLTSLMPASPLKDHTVNPVIGDESFFNTFGTAPTRDTPELVRLQTHLKYVLSRLNAKDVSALPQDLQAARRVHLRDLETYIEQGVFPRNTLYPGERKPCFIDDDGRICAVGYLIEQSAGRAVAERVNQDFQYAVLLEMKSPELDVWASQSGLTKTELAMIQPTYGEPIYGVRPQPFDERVEAVPIGLNAAAFTINAILLARNERSPVTAGIGIASGITSIAMGLSEKANFPATDIALGIASVIIGLYQFIPREELPTAAPQVRVGVVPDGNSGTASVLNLRWTF